MNGAGSPVHDTWPQSHLDATAHHEVGGVQQPVVVEVLGHLHIAVCGEPVTTGLRTRARALFVWFLLRPEGASSEEAVEALWPDTPPERVRRQFWRSFSDLRARLRAPGGDALEVFIKSGEHYQPSVSEIACDLWTFQAALAQAAHADTDDEARVALRRAVEVYRADLLSGTDYPWVEPVRQDLHRRALDALLRLAELENLAARHEAAADLLERAIAIDRYAEEPYRRLMALQAACGRSDAVTATWQLLQSRLRDLDLDVEDATASLYRQLTTERAATSPGSVGWLK
jgi:LuxR family maltose regulon positive regulatory protein